MVYNKELFKPNFHRFLLLYESKSKNEISDYIQI